MKVLSTLQSHLIGNRMSFDIFEIADINFYSLCSKNKYKVFDLGIFFFIQFFKSFENECHHIYSFYVFFVSCIFQHDIIIFSSWRIKLKLTLQRDNLMSQILVFLTKFLGGCHVPDRMVVGFTTTCTIVPITTNLVSLNTAHDEVYSILH
jgi:hypothetical protein